LLSNYNLSYSKRILIFQTDCAVRLCPSTQQHTVRTNARLPAGRVKWDAGLALSWWQFAVLPGQLKKYSG